MSDSNDAQVAQVAQVGRNEPCPCGSGKKYKRCHGVDAAPKLTTPSAPAGMPAGLPPGLDQMDPAMMMQLSQAFQKLPRAQMQKFQSLMQRAMAGQDVSREAELLEKTLPPEFKSMMEGFAAQMPAQAAAATASDSASAASGDMSVDDARRVVEEAVKAGKLTREQADALLNPKG